MREREKERERERGKERETDISAGEMAQSVRMPT
jgi:hypothetical protein